MLGRKKGTEIISEQIIPVKKAGRKVPELTTLVRTATGNRKYQQDAVYVRSEERRVGKECRL